MSGNRCAKQESGAGAAPGPGSGWYGLAVAVLVLPLGLALAQTPRPIPHAAVASGQRDIAAAWLAEPTRRYAHGVLGDDIEAGALHVRTPAGLEYVLRADGASVFEDLTPRLADIDGDGRDEVWTVRSDRLGGARLEAYALEAGGLRRRYATAPIGTAYRWLNPIGVADFDGDGRHEAAYVETPHLGGVVTVVRPRGAALIVVARRRGYSNHVLGSVRLDLAAIADLDGDGGAEIVVPDQRRTRLAVLSLVAGQLVERWRSEPGPEVDGALRLRRQGGGWRADYLGAGAVPATVEIRRAELRSVRQ